MNIHAGWLWERMYHIPPISVGAKPYSKVCVKQCSKVKGGWEEIKLNFPDFSFSINKAIGETVYTVSKRFQILYYYEVEFQ